MSRPERTGHARRASASPRACSSAAAALAATAAEPQPYRYAAPIEIVQACPVRRAGAAAGGLCPCGAAGPARPARRRRGRRARALRAARSDARGGSRRAAARGDALSLAAAAGGQRGVALAGRGHGRRRPDHGAPLRRRRADGAAAPRESPGWLIDLGELRPGRPGAAAPAAALVRPDRVLGRLRDRDQCRPAQLAPRIGRPGDVAAIVERRAGAADRRLAGGGGPLRPPHLARPGDGADAHRRGLGRRHPGRVAVAAANELVCRAEPGARRQGARSRGARSTSISAAGCR